MKPHFLLVPPGEVPRTPQGTVIAACGAKIEHAECLAVWDEQPSFRTLNTLAGCQRCAAQVASQSGVVYAVRSQA